MPPSVRVVFTLPGSFRSGGHVVDTGKTLGATALEKHRGQWIVVDRNWQRIIASSPDPEECAKQARAAAQHGQVYVYRVPSAGDFPPAGQVAIRAPSPATPKV